MSTTRQPTATFVGPTAAILEGMFAARVRELLNYDQETGAFTWRTARPKVRIGAIAGGPCDLHWKIRIDGRRYYAHRLAWLHTYGRWPSGRLDHKNRNGLDNRLSNLREATRSQNSANTATRKTSSTGFKGVSKYRSRFVAQIRVLGNNRHIGVFDTPEQAHAAYRRAAVTAFGEFACFESSGAAR